MATPHAMVCVTKERWSLLYSILDTFDGFTNLSAPHPGLTVKSRSLYHLSRHIDAWIGTIYVTRWLMARWYYVPILLYMYRCQPFRSPLVGSNKYAARRLNICLLMPKQHAMLLAIDRTWLRILQSFSWWDANLTRDCITPHPETSLIVYIAGDKAMNI